MARLLVFDRDVSHSDPARDRLAYKRGDVVYVAEDGHAFSAKEQAAPFRIVDLPGPAESYRHLKDGEPRTVRDSYPAALVGQRRLHKAMRAEMDTKPRRRRQWRITDADQIARKFERD